MIKKKKKRRLASGGVPEGFSPIYHNGIITPETEGLGPKYEKDIKLEKMPPSVKPKPKKTPNKVPERVKPHKGKRYYA